MYKYIVFVAMGPLLNLEPLPVEQENTYRTQSESWDALGFFKGGDRIRARLLKTEPCASAYLYDDAIYMG